MSTTTDPPVSVAEFITVRFQPKKSCAKSRTDSVSVAEFITVRFQRGRNPLRNCVEKVSVAEFITVRFQLAKHLQMFERDEFQ